MTNKFLTSDLHFGHAKICEYTGRPYPDVPTMNADLVARWNSRVAPDDEVWILGDLAMGKLDDSLTYIEFLNGTKFLVPGNHDRMFDCQGTKYANAAQRYVDAGIAEVLEPEIGLVLGKFGGVTACHFPYQGDSRTGEEDRYQEHRPANRGGYLVHGHTHGAWRRKGKMIDVGVDAWGGYPVSFDEVGALFSWGDADPIPWTS